MATSPLLLVLGSLSVCKESKREKVKVIPLSLSLSLARGKETGTTL